jgi:hypothetical protein
MYCPRCRRPMEERGAVFTCERGQMETSLMLALGLREYATSEAVPIEENDLLSGGKLCCPSCAAPLREQESCFRCTGCGEGLAKRLIYMMIELHPHRDC